ncbi:hypothetical protein MYX07_00240 [Patescibacteria group bacterium AH-259-L07]|nr:hypothetical protein [Patescibacteria group bacterium AH-259-L07]
MIKVKYSEQDIFELTEQEFKKALSEWNKGRSVFVRRLGASLSPYYRWAGVEPVNPNAGYTRDGRKMFRKFGEWRFVECPELKPDLTYYPEIAKDELLTEQEFKNRYLLKKADEKLEKKKN